ncbi:MAG: hypothetical protein AVDCRST_MAG93-2330, partial [uncultured Chloroflexia bacterium]
CRYSRKSNSSRNQACGFIFAFRIGTSRTPVSSTIVASSA